MQVAVEDTEKDFAAGIGRIVCKVLPLAYTVVRVLEKGAGHPLLLPTPAEDATWNVTHEIVLLFGHEIIPDK